MQADSRPSFSAMRLFSATAVAVAVVTSGVTEARQMHAGLDYHRYLAEKNQTRSEVDEWKAKFGDMAKANGMMPPRPSSSVASSEERSIVDEDEDEDEIEDHLQRFFMTKQNITAMQALNPNANFSTDSPFSLMTNDEFGVWVGKAYRSFNGSSLGSGSSWLASTSTGGSAASGRRLRSSHHHSSSHRSSSTTTTYGGTASGDSKPSGKTWGTTSGTSGTGTYTSSEHTTVTSTTTSGTGGTHTSTTTTTTTSSSPGEEHTTVTTTSSAGSSAGKGKAATAFSGSSGFSSMLASMMSQMGGGFGFAGLPANEIEGTVQPAGSSDSTWSSSWSSGWPSGWAVTPSSTASATTTAPAAATTAPTPTTVAPTPTTVTPTPTTAAPTITPTATTATPMTASPAAAKDTSSASTTSVESTDSVASVASDSDSVDWTDSSCMSPIQSQGSCGNCWAFSTVAAVETAQCIANGQTGLTKYSEQQPTSCDTQNYGCNGGAPVYAMEYIQENGLCTEDDYPYTSSEGTAASCVTGCSAVNTGITGYEKLDDESGLVARVAKQPVVVAVASGNTVWKQYTGGVISSCDTSSLDHAVVVVGFDDSEWKIRNSWGDSWGEEGYIRLARTSDSTGTCGMYEDMSYPTFDL